LPPVPPRSIVRLPALLALALPVLAGLAYMAAFGAPGEYLLVNALALALGLLWIAFGRLPREPAVRKALAVALLLLLILPLLTGPDVRGVTRWLPLGPVALHTGMLAIPPLAVLATSDLEDAPLLLLAALFAVLIQPDAASAFALTFAAVGLHRVTQDWRIGAVTVVAFFTAIAAALRGELPAEQFVERVLVEAAFDHPVAGLGLFAAMLGGFFLMLYAAPLPRAARFALCGSLFGFGISAIMSNYPSPLIGFGAAPILGYALALSDRSARPEPAR
jgi:cell division protein FtsW (lipid II flippase)